MGDTHNEILVFTALEWFEKKDDGLRALSIEFTSQWGFDNETGELWHDVSAINDHAGCWDEWIGGYVNKTIKAYNRRGYRIRDFIREQSPLNPSGPMGRDEKHHAHIEHRIIVVMEKASA
jgi:hypothetical protein